MKQITIIFMLVLASFSTFSQTKFNAGIYAEGGSFLPKGESNGFTSGGGLFASSTFNKKLAITLQAGYRYKSNKTEVAVWNNNDGYSPYGYYSGYGYGYVRGTADKTGEYSFKQHYIILPLKVSYLLTKRLFVETGIEAACILNYDKTSVTQLPDGSYHLPETYNSINEKYEFDWIVGLGYSLSPKLKASVNYTQGFKDQGMSRLDSNGDNYGQVYKNRMLMLNLSYSLFSIGKNNK